MKKTSLKDKSIISILTMLIGICIMILGSMAIEWWNILSGVLIIVGGMLIAVVSFAMLLFPVYWYNGVALEGRSSSILYCEFRDSKTSNIAWYFVGGDSCRSCKYYQGKAWLKNYIACELNEAKCVKDESTKLK